MVKMKKIKLSSLACLDHFRMGFQRGSSDITEAEITLPNYSIHLKFHNGWLKAEMDAGSLFGTFCLW